MSCERGEDLVLTSRRLISLEPAGDQAQPLVLPPSMKSIGGSVVHRTEDALFVGADVGEFGGGLAKLDRRSGRVEQIESGPAPGPAPCERVLETRCDPVTGIATIPWKPDCVAAAIGSLHGLWSGSIAEVCDGAVSLLFTQVADRVTRDPEKLAEAARGEYGSVAFFHVASRADVLLAAGHDGLYRLERSGKVSYRRWPSFRRIGGVAVSFDFPGLVVVLRSARLDATPSPMLALR
jgi:hypothetical protein